MMERLITLKQLRQVQTVLQRYGYYQGPIRILNVELHQPIAAFQKDLGLTSTGELDDETLQHLLDLYQELEKFCHASA